MTRLKSSKIFIQKDGLFSFMWANIAPDDSVMMGFPFETSEEIELVIDQERGELRPPEIRTNRVTGRSKISFHPSGKFKLASKVGLSDDATDRATVDGPAFKDITEPVRLLEILIPKRLILSSSKPTDRDIVLNAPIDYIGPLRCTVSCVAREKLSCMLKSEALLVDTSIWESTHALESETHAWVWTLRATKEDQVFFDRFGVFLFGHLKWGRPTNAF